MPYTTALHAAQPPEAGQWQIQFKSQKKEEQREQSYTRCQVWANLLFSKIKVYWCYHDGVTSGMSQTIIIFVVENLIIL